MISQWGSQKWIGASWIHSLPSLFFNLFLTWWIVIILLKGRKQDNFEPQNSLKLSFTNIQGVPYNFAECKLFLESDSPDILALCECESNLDDSVDSSSFSVRGYLPLIWKDAITHMHGLAFYAKEGLPFALDLSLENSVDSYLCFELASLHSLSYFFFLHRSPTCLLWSRTSLLCYSFLFYFILCIWGPLNQPTCYFFSLETLTPIIRTG